MAAFDAIAVTSRAILGVIEDARPADFERARFRLFQSVDMDSPREGFAEGISLYLYRVTFNTTRRNMPPRRDPIKGTRRRPPVPLDLHFLLTAWAADAGQQQRLLGWAVRTLEDTPILPAILERCAGRSRRVSPSETVELVARHSRLRRKTSGRSPKRGGNHRSDMWRAKWRLTRRSGQRRRAGPRPRIQTRGWDWLLAPRLNLMP